ncbi:MAG: tRNA guanosine(34) transglycosylase Tgt [Chloroflexota bacterium]
MSAIELALTHGTSLQGPRRGQLRTPHGSIETPAFITVGTQAAVKGVTPAELRAAGAEAVLANTYHLYLRPGADLVAQLGGLHRFMAWDGPIFTDSGGYQVFSLGFGMEHGIGKQVGMFPDEPSEGLGGPRKPGQRPKLTKVDDEGVGFTSHIDGSRHRLTPASSIQIQEQLGADIILAFDEPTSPLHDAPYTQRAMERTHRWAKQCLAARTRSDQALYGIVQGGAFPELRKASSHEIGGLEFDGFAIGGSLGRTKRDMEHVLNWSIPNLPESAPRHMLGIGEPEDLFTCVRHGIDTFDCVAPTRHARRGVLYTASGKLNIAAAKFRDDDQPIEADCDCYTCREFSRAYLCHLFRARELLAYTLASIHNLHAILGLMSRIRAAIVANDLEIVERMTIDAYRAHREGAPAWGAASATFD